MNDSSEPIEANIHDVRSVDIPKRVHDRIEARLPRTEFDSVEEYLTYIAEEVLYRVETETDDDYEPVDESEVEERLKSLGYLNE